MEDVFEVLSPNYTEYELKAKIEKLVGTLTEEQWDKVLDSYAGLDMTFDDSDFVDYLGKAKNLFNKFPRTETRQADGKELDIELPPNWIQLSEEVAKSLEPRAERLRSYLGISNPFKLESLRDWLYGQRGDKFVWGNGDIDLAFPQANSKYAAHLLIQRDISNQKRLIEYFSDRGDLENVKKMATDSLKRAKEEKSLGIKKLFQIKKEAERLTEETGWDEGQAVYFLLCGLIPLLPYLRIEGRYRFYGRQHQGYRRGHYLTIEIADLSVPAEAVKRAYQKARSQMLKGLGSDKARRPLKEKTARLFRFVKENQQLPWDKKCRHWNKQHPKNKYNSGRSMSVAYNQARKRQGF